MVGEKIKDNISLRTGNVRAGIQEEIGIIREFAGDVKKRVIDGQEPTMGVNLFGVPGAGKRGSLPMSVMAVGIKTLDNLETRVQTFAKKNLALIRR